MVAGQWLEATLIPQTDQQVATYKRPGGKLSTRTEIKTQIKGKGEVVRWWRRRRRRWRRRRRRRMKGRGRDDDEGRDGETSPWEKHAGKEIG